MGLDSLALDMASAPMKVVTSEEVVKAIREQGFSQTMLAYVLVALVTIVFFLLIKDTFKRNREAERGVKKIVDKVEANTLAIRDMIAIIRDLVVGKPLEIEQTDILYKWGMHSHRTEKIKLARPILREWIQGEINATTAYLKVKPIFERVTSDHSIEFNAFHTVFGRPGDEISKRLEFQDFMEQYMSCWRPKKDGESVLEAILSIEEDCDTVMQNFVAKIRKEFKLKR